MNLQSHRLFANMCGQLLEDSSSLSIVGQHPGGQAVFKKLHTTNSLAHDQSYSPVDKISWSDLKDSYRGSWVIIIGATGTGAIRSSGGNTGNYDALASSGGEVRQLTASRGGTILDFLKGEIGNLRKFYVGKNTTAVKDKRSQRASNNKPPASAVTTNDTLVKKFKPLWTKAVSSAVADIKGMASTMIKNDAFDKAEKKINTLKTLNSALDTMQNAEGEVPGFIKSAVNIAVMMSASHYYPEETGEIRKERYGAGYTSERPEGPQKLLADISAGDTQKLGTILSFFKRSLISG